MLNKSIIFPFDFEPSLEPKKNWITPTKPVPIKIPIAHGEGKYFADEETLESLIKNDQILFKYCDENGQITEKGNPNGSTLNIAGICNADRNVFGMMPHPERPNNNFNKGISGKDIFVSMIKNFN